MLLLIFFHLYSFSFETFYSIEIFSLLPLLHFTSLIFIQQFMLLLLTRSTSFPGLFPWRWVGLFPPYPPSREKPWERGCDALKVTHLSCFHRLRNLLVLEFGLYLEATFQLINLCHRGYSMVASKEHTLFYLFFFTCDLAATFLRLRCDFPATFLRLSCDFPAT